MIDFKAATKASTLADIAGVDLHGEDKIVSRIAPIESATSSDITFIAESNLVSDYSSKLENTKAGIVVLPTNLVDSAPDRVSVIAVDNPKSALRAILLELCADEYTAMKSSSFELPANVTGASEIHPSVNIGPNVTIGNDCVIGEGVCLMANVVIFDNVIIGDNTVIFPNVVVYSRSRIGSNCKIQSNSTIGSEGFGYNNNDGRWEYMPHLAGLVIEDNVEIGANTSIDRGFLSDTVIGSGTIIDNQCQIAHGVTIGKNVAIAGCSGIAGSTSVGDHCMFGGRVNVAGHISIVKGTILSGSTSVSKSITKPGVYCSGLPAKPREDWQKNIARIHLLDNLYKKVRNIEKTIKKIVFNDDKETING